MKFIFAVALLALGLTVIQRHEQRRDVIGEANRELREYETLIRRMTEAVKKIDADIEKLGLNEDIKDKGKR